MQTLSAEEFKKKYGTQGVQAFKETPQKSGAGADISNAFQGGVSQIKKGYEQAKAAKNPIESLEGGLNQATGAVSAAFSPLAPVTKYVGQGIDYAANKISDNPSVQKFAQSKTGEVASRIAEDTANTAALLGLKGASKGVRPAVGMASDAASVAIKGATKAVEPATAYLGKATRDVIPTTEAIINHQVTKALDLAPSDLDKISRSTGNSVGTWLAENNLIGENKELTKGLVDDFYLKNYENVRAEVGKVQTPYAQYQIPRYVDALKQIVEKIGDTPGLEKTWVEATNMLGKKEVMLADVQRVKEMLDEHFSLYKATGDVAQGVAKEGLANMRKDLRKFIEDQVKENTGADISQMNNNVSTARSLSEAIKTRSPKGLTQANIKPGDWGAFGVASWIGGGPLVGIAALFAKKLLESPTVRLRIAKFLDGVDDTKKAKIKADLEAGEIPNDFKKIIKIKHKGQLLPAE